MPHDDELSDERELLPESLDHDDESEYHASDEPHDEPHIDELIGISPDAGEYVQTAAPESLESLDAQLEPVPYP